MGRPCSMRISICRNISGLLNPAGTNVLAVHGLNSSLTSSDFLIGPQLVLTRGRIADGFMVQPTPGAANAVGVAGFVADTQFSVDRGFYGAPMTVAITCATPGAVIRYTRNGDTPTATTGFCLQRAGRWWTALPCCGRRPSGMAGKPSNVDTHTYFFLDDVVTQSADGSAPSGWPAGCRQRSALRLRDGSRGRGCWPTSGHAEAKPAGDSNGFPRDGSVESDGPGHRAFMSVRRTAAKRPSARFRWRF